MCDWLEVLRTGAGEFGLRVSAEEEAAFAQYLSLLLEWNTRCNLTAITDPVEVAAKHFVDSLSVETVWQARPGMRALDLGTGAGLPGIPLAIRHPETLFTLVDSTRKKVTFLDAVAAELPLANVQPLWARVEALGHQPEHRGHYHAVLARAVAHLGLLIEYAMPLLRAGGVLIAMKGPGGLAEIEASRKALQALSSTISVVKSLTVPGAGERLLIVVRAERVSPPQYPREAAAMKKRPLFLDSDRPTP